jgi:sugar (pentulose or hexulose) kinase
MAKGILLGFFCLKFLLQNLNTVIPMGILPKIVKPGFNLGTLTTNRFEHPNGVKVLVALGDVQASLYKVARKQEPVLHIGTSAQITFISNEKPAVSQDLSHLLRWPYFNEQWLVMAAALNGGNVFQLWAEVGGWLII